jgi:hypothetical protein
MGNWKGCRPVPTIDNPAKQTNSDVVVERYVFTGVEVNTVSFLRLADLV